MLSQILDVMKRRKHRVPEGLKVEFTAERKHSGICQSEKDPMGLA